MELFWLLLPVAAWSGWFAARRTGPSPRRGRPPPPEGYYQGLNYLLNEQPDKAIEVFTRMLEVNSDTVETHLALGSLFRRRGEVDRAIKIHQNLIARPSLGREQRTYALLELGEDYMRAGLLDRAESLFEQVVQSGLHVAPALQQLLVIYQQEREWDRAIEIAQRLDSRGGVATRPLIAQFICEQAEQAALAGDPNAVRQLLRRALAQDPDCVRASLLLARLERDAGNLKVAVKTYLRVGEQDPEFLPEVLAPLRECYLGLGQPEAMQRYLEQVVADGGGALALLLLVDLIHQQQGPRAAARKLAERLRERPHIVGIERLLRLAMEEGEASGRADLREVSGLLNDLVRDRPQYECRQCGFTAKTLYWQCPSCRSWATVKPGRERGNGDDAIRA